MSDRFDHTLEHTLETKPADDTVTTLRRIEVITGAGRRRQWPEDDKARIIIESLRPGANVSEVARRNGLSPQQLFGWRRKARALMAERADRADAREPEQATPAAACLERGGSQPSAGGSSADPVPAFASVMIAAAAPPSPPAGPPTSGRIEIALGDTVVRVIGQVEPATLTVVLRAVRMAT